MYSCVQERRGSNSNTSLNNEINGIISLVVSQNPVGLMMYLMNAIGILININYEIFIVFAFYNQIFIFRFVYYLIFKH